MAGGGEGNEDHGGDRGVATAVGAGVVAPAAERTLGAQDHLDGALERGLDLLVVLDVVGHPPHLRHGEGEEPVLIHPAHVSSGGFPGFLEQEVLGAVERRAMPAEAGEVAFHHEGHEAEGGAGDLVIACFGSPRTVGILGGDEVLQTALDREVGGFGELGRGFTGSDSNSGIGGGLILSDERGDGRGVDERGEGNARPMEDGGWSNHFATFS